MATQPITRASSFSPPSPPTSNPPGGGQQQGPGGTVVRWLWTWIALGILVVVTVIGFLIGIVRSLESIDAGLFEASSAVSGAGGDVVTLPSSISSINKNLTEIDTALKPIRSQADEIGTGLGSITTSLQDIDASLKDTDASLADTSSSLADTSGVLVKASDSVGTIDGSLADTSNVLSTVLGQAGDIESELEAAQNADSQGTDLIPDNVAVANDILGPAQGDTSSITGQLGEVNENLTGICNSPVLTVLGAATQPNC